VKSYIAMGLFAFLVTIISLLRIMADQEFYRLTAMKRAWGRSRGLSLHFVSSVVLPLICGVVFFTGGISGVQLIQPLIAEKPFSSPAPLIKPLKQPQQPLPALADIYTSLA